MSFCPELDSLSLNELIAKFHGPPPEDDPEGDFFYEEAAVKIAEHGEPGFAFLRGAIDASDESHLRGVILALSWKAPGEPALWQWLASLLEDPRESIVVYAIDGLAQSDASDHYDRVMRLRQHPSPYVQGAVLRYVASLFPDRAFPLLIEALQDPHYIVRENAADELGELGDPAAIPHLRPLLADSHPHVRQAVETAIDMLEPPPTAPST